MWVIDTEAAPARLRGLLSRWGVEVRAGLYIGSTGAKMRDAIWELTRRELGASGNAVLVYDARTPQGFEVRTTGQNRRVIADVDGLWLAKFEPHEPVPFGEATSEEEPAETHLAESTAGLQVGAASAVTPGFDVDELYLEE